jgi:hypothetical protein
MLGRVLGRLDLPIAPTDAPEPMPMTTTPLAKAKGAARRAARPLLTRIDALVAERAAAQEAHVERRLEEIHAQLRAELAGARAELDASLEVLRAELHAR